jgi:cell division protein FtsN
METPMSMSRHRFTSNAPRVVGWVIGGIILAVIFAFIFGYFVMLLWNKFKRKFKPPFDKISKWHFYDEYWKEEGEAAFNQFVEKKKAGQNGEKENPAE